MWDALLQHRGLERRFDMSQAVTTGKTRPVVSASRDIDLRTFGNTRGAITRLMSPGDLGEALKPFVFLDFFDTVNASFSGMNLHPHSGIVTVTHLFEGSVRYEDTTGATGTLPAGGVEWFKAGGGAWHGGGPGKSGRTRGFQLWLALPPDHELGPVESIYQAPDLIERDGPARVLVGAHGKAKSALTAPSSMNYLAVHLKAGESWRYQPPQNHSVAWIAVGKGRLAIPEEAETGELIVFEPGNHAIDFQAETDSEFVLGSAAEHPHDLVLGYYSVHTSPASLEKGERQINEIKARLIRDGRL
jgi:redox-sensitive bicupin YhaK (pirin superfamily)